MSGLAVGSIGHTDDVVGQQQLVELSGRHSQFPAMGVELCERGPFLLAPCVRHPLRGLFAARYRPRARRDHVHGVRVGVSRTVRPGAIRLTSAEDTGCRRWRGESEAEAALRHMRRRFSTVDSLRAAVTKLVNATFAARDTPWEGGGAACASDSKKFGSWSSNFMTEYPWLPGEGDGERASPMLAVPRRWRTGHQAGFDVPMTTSTAWRRWAAKRGRAARASRARRAAASAWCSWGMQSR